MVITQQVQHGMYGQETDFPFEGVSVQICLPHSGFQRDDHIAEQGTAGFLADVILSVYAEREREHVRHTVFFPVNSVQIPNFGIADKRNAYFRIMWKLFHHQNCLTAAANQHPNPHWHFDCLLIVFHHNLYTHHFSTFLSR